LGIGTGYHYRANGQVLTNGILGNWEFGNSHMTITRLYQAVVQIFFVCLPPHGCVAATAMDVGIPPDAICDGVPNAPVVGFTGYSQTVSVFSLVM
jgi:hypothetical protein